MNCPACGRPTVTLDARSMFKRAEATGELITGSQLLIECPSPPDGCGTRRLVWREVIVKDQGETQKRWIPHNPQHTEG